MGCFHSGTEHRYRSGNYCNISTIFAIQLLGFNFKWKQTTFYLIICQIDIDSFRKGRTYMFWTFYYNHLFRKYMTFAYPFLKCYRVNKCWILPLTHKKWNYNSPGLLINVKHMKDTNRLLYISENQEQKITKRFIGQYIQQISVSYPSLVNITIENK